MDMVCRDRFFSRQKLFGHLQTVNTKAVGTVVSDHKEMLEILFSEKPKKVRKTMKQRDQLMA
jgi:hypothetical protein